MPRSVGFENFRGILDCFSFSPSLWWPSSFWQLLLTQSPKLKQTQWQVPAVDSEHIYLWNESSMLLTRSLKMEYKTNTKRNWTYQKQTSNHMIKNVVFQIWKLRYTVQLNLRKCSLNFVCYCMLRLSKLIANMVDLLWFFSASCITNTNTPTSTSISTSTSTSTSTATSTSTRRPTSTSTSTGTSTRAATSTSTVTSTSTNTDTSTAARVPVLEDKNAVVDEVYCSGGKEGSMASPWWWILAPSFSASGWGSSANDNAIFTAPFDAIDCFFLWWKVAVGHFWVLMYVLLSQLVALKCYDVLRSINILFTNKLNATSYYQCTTSQNTQFSPINRCTRGTTLYRIACCFFFFFAKHNS